MVVASAFAFESSNFQAFQAFYPLNIKIIMLNVRIELLLYLFLGFTFEN